MIRTALPEDLPRLVEMGTRFVAETPYRDLVRVNPQRLVDTIVNVMSSEDGTVFVSGSDATVTGMIALVIYEHPYSGERTASELAWWVEPESRGDGVRLLRAAEEWGRERGATRMQMIAPNERVGGLYSRLGYAPIETTYQRSL